MPRAILFRTPTASDTYHTHLASAGYSPTSLPALADSFLPGALTDIVSRGGGEWEAVVITSRRAAEAWVLAARSASASISSLPSRAEGEGDISTDGRGTFSPPHSLTPEPWSDVPVWSPGPAVPNVLASAGLPPAYVPRSAPTAVSAAALAPLILGAPPRPLRADRGASGSSEAGTAQGDACGDDGSNGGYRPYLVLTGDKTLPLLTEALEGAGRVVRRVKVYETREAPELGGAVRELAREMAEVGRPRRGSGGGEGGGGGEADGEGEGEARRAGEGNGEDEGEGEGEARSDGGEDGRTWLALFSPSSASYVLPHLLAAGFAVRPPPSPAHAIDAGAEGLVPVRIAAIGETTEAALRAGGWRVDAVARTPDAPGLVWAIVEADAGLVGGGGEERERRA